jgi:uncharacterized membrane protein
LSENRNRSRLAFSIEQTITFHLRNKPINANNFIIIQEIKMPKAKKPRAKKMMAKGGRKTADSARTKLREALSRAKQIKKELNTKLKAKTAEFKKKLQEVEKLALSRALETLEREIAKKEEAKRKVLATAEASFEKRYAKKFSKGTKRKPATKGRKAVKKSTGKRGRRAAKTVEMTEAVE